VPPFPWPDYWIPLPATGSGPPVLRRRWTPAAPTPSAPPRDCWTPAPLNHCAVPVLERHWACSTPSPGQTAPARASTDSEETITVARNTSGRLTDCLALLDRTATPVPRIIMPAPLDSSPQTVTRLCVGCGNPLEGKRPQAKAHGAACRQRAYRRRKKEARQTLGQRENGRGSGPQLRDLARTTVG